MKSSLMPWPVSPISTRTWPLYRHMHPHSARRLAWRRVRSAQGAPAHVRAVVMAARGQRLDPVGSRSGARLSASTAACHDERQVHAARSAGWCGPSRNCSIRRRIFSSELSTVSSMSSWNSGLLRSRLAFFSISESCVTMFLRSCTTKADMRLKASNLRASSKRFGGAASAPGNRRPAGRRS
jgi:hypothetical protein